MALFNRLFKVDTSSAVYKDTEKFLYALRDAGSKYSLSRIRRLAEILGNPQEKYPVIHVAGTNGKGSVCAMLEAALRENDLKAGLYTSPHLVRIGERVQVNRKILSEERIVDEICRLRKIADSIFDPSAKADYPSFFEYMTALAFDVFADEKVDCAVVEVGLGGLLDSTNIVLPEISVITSIGYDHTQMLGSRLCEIAGQKAGIIKPNVPVVCGFLPEEAMKVIEDRARSLSAPLYKVSDFFPNESSLPKTSLAGLYQRRNAAVAWLVLNVLRCRAATGKASKIFRISDSKIENALMHVAWDARWQTVKLSSGGTLILDASHNEEGAKALESNLKDLIVKTGERPDIAVGVLDRERAIPLLKVVEKYAGKIWLLVPDQPRALNHAGLRSCMEACNTEIVDSDVRSLFEAPNVCRVVGKGRTIVCTGSIYLAGEVMSTISGVCADSLQDRPYGA